MLLDALSSLDISHANMSNCPEIRQETANLIDDLTFGSNIHFDCLASLTYTLHSTITRSILFDYSGK